MFCRFRSGTSRIKSVRRLLPPDYWLGEVDYLGGSMKMFRICLGLAIACLITLLVIEIACQAF